MDERTMVGEYKVDTSTLKVQMTKSFAPFFNSPSTSCLWEEVQIHFPISYSEMHQTDDRYTAYPSRRQEKERVTKTRREESPRIPDVRSR